MNQIKCVMKDCDSIFETTEPVSSKARFICKNHNRRTVLKELGRTFIEGKDDADKNIHFQDHQFDKDLRRSSRPTGTEHIHRQGSDTDEVPRAQEIELVDKGLL